MNRRAKFDAASFILGRGTRNRTNTQKNSQTVNDISTTCLSACVDNNRIRLNEDLSSLTDKYFKKIN